MRQTATRCWRCAVPSIMARSTKYLCVIDSDYEKRQNDRMQGKLTHPLAVALASDFFQGSQLGLKFSQDLAAVSPLAFFLLGIVADHVATTALPLTYHHFLDPQVVRHLLKPTRALEDVVGDLIPASHRHTQDVLAPALAEPI